MQFMDALNYISSHEYAARVSVASGLEAFERAVMDQEASQVVLEHLKRSMEYAGYVLWEIIDLSGADIDWKYANQWDDAIAALLLLLHMEYPQLAKVASHAADRAPSCYWTRQVFHKMKGIPT